MRPRRTAKQSAGDEHYLGSLPSPQGSDVEGTSERWVEATAGHPGHHRVHRGANNRAMQDYADLVGARYLVKDGMRCICGHVDSRFVVKGSQRVCQVCFAKGVRF